MESIFHILGCADYDQATQVGYVAPDSLATDGFVHCAYATQVCDVANHHYRGRLDVVLVEIDPSEMDCRVVDEDLYGLGELFPHIYGVIPLKAVVAVRELKPGADGQFELPGLGESAR